MIDSAIERGELSSSIDRELAFDFIPSPLYWRMVVRGKSVQRGDEACDRHYGGSSGLLARPDQRIGHLVSGAAAHGRSWRCTASSSAALPRESVQHRSASARCADISGGQASANY